MKGTDPGDEHSKAAFVDLSPESLDLFERFVEILRSVLQLRTEQ